MHKNSGKKRFDAFRFWQQWLVYSSIIFALFGVVFAVNGNNLLFRPYNDALARIFWNADTIPGDIEPFRAFIYAPLGGTIACCYILLAYIAWYPFRNKERWARNSIIAAFGIWITLDSGVCLYYHVFFQIWMINLFSFLVKALPLFFTWKYFRDASSTDHSVAS